MRASWYGCSISVVTAVPLTDNPAKLCVFMEHIDATPALQAGRPLYLQVKDALSANLAGGIWKPGDQLPTETELSKQFDVSEGTVRQAVMALVKEGRLTRRSGKGTFVSRPNFEHSFMRFFRFRGNVASRDPEYGLTVLDIKARADADPAIRRTLRLASNAKILSIHRAIMQDGEVVCHYVSYLSNPEFGGLSPADLENAALYDVLEKKYGINILRAVETLQAKAAEANDVAILGVRLGEPVIAIDRHAYTYGDRVVEVRYTVGRSDKFRYQIQLS